MRANTVVRQIHNDMKSGYRLKFLPIRDTPSDNLVIGVVQDASFASQPGEGSQMGYFVLRAFPSLFNSESVCHVMD